MKVWLRYLSDFQSASEGDGVTVDDTGLIHLTDASFDKFINSKKGIQFVKFYAPW